MTNHHEQNIKDVKTSKSHPLRIDYVSPLGCDGRIGMTFCPGKKGYGIYSGYWNRDLDLDIQMIKKSNPSAVFTLMEAHECYVLGVPDLFDAFKKSQMNWFHLPIKDTRQPDAEFEPLWDAIKDEVHTLLKSGESIVIHCRGGIGRTGLLAARILIEMGEEPVSAVRRVRTARPGAIETMVQERYVFEKQWLKIV